MPQRAPLFQLTEAEWNKALAFADRSHLTLALGLTSRDQLPGSVKERIDDNLICNAERWSRIQTVYKEAACAFKAEGLDFVVLKGFTHCPYFVSDPRHRPQNDIDLLFRRDQIFRARDIAAGLGYEPIRNSRRVPLDHLPTMIRRTGWQWHGDYFDPEIPLSLELHFRLWDDATERFGPKGLDQFWERREVRKLDDVCFGALHTADAVAYATLHLLRHLLRGDLRPYHLYELAWFLDRHADDAPLWTTWCELHDESLRKLQAICFGLAHRWFNCRMSETAIEEIDRLAPDVTRWLETHSASPLEGLFHPNKDELWLHWSLLTSPRDRLAVVRRRLLPEKLPGLVDAVHLAADQITWRVRLRSLARWTVYSASRVAHHTRALLPTAVGAVRWFTRSPGFGAQYWRFYLAAAFFNFGLFIFFLLYNLYLLQLGFRENFLGLVSSAMTAGSVAGCIPAAIAIRRYGIRNTLLAGFTLIVCLSALRASVTFAPALLGLAFCGGLVASVWAVAISPAIAQLTTERNRTFGFSVVFSSGIAIGILGGLAGGRLPGWLTKLHMASSNVQAYRESLLFGCAMVLVALWPLSRTRLGVAPPAERRVFRPNPLVVRFLIAIAVWNLGTGGFNPFFSAFFARMRVSVAQIGFLSSLAHVVQAGAMLLAPLVLRRFGLVRGISSMQFATALALAALAGAHGIAWAGVAFAAYTAVQYMSEPGMYTYLMDAVPAGERSAASALNFFVAFAANAVASATAGVVITRFGYTPLLFAASFICGAGAMLFRTLCDDSKTIR